MSAPVCMMVLSLSVLSLVVIVHMLQEAEVSMWVVILATFEEMFGRHWASW